MFTRNFSLILLFIIHTFYNSLENIFLCCLALLSIQYYIITDIYSYLCKRYSLILSVVVDLYIDKDQVNDDSEAVRLTFEETLRN